MAHRYVRQLIQRNAQYCFFYLAQFFHRRDRYGFISPSRYAVLVATRPAAHGSTGRQRLLHPVQPGLVFNISDVVLGQLPGVERLEAHSRARRRAAGFTDFPLLI